MQKPVILIVVAVVLMFGISNISAQDSGETTLRILAIDYMGDVLEQTGIYDMGISLEVTIVNQQELEVFAREGILTEFDLVLVDNITLAPLISELSNDFFVDICDIAPELCPPPIPEDLCARFPWLPGCGNPCESPFGWTCPPVIFWDIPIIIDPWDPMPWTLDDLITVVETETVMVDPRNGVGFFLEPEIFNLARPNLTIELEEAFLVFTPACNYVMHYDEFTEMGFLPITVEGYLETPFNVGPYIPANGNVELATEFTSLLLNDVNVQLSVFETTGLLPSNVDALTEILPQ